MSLSKPVSSIPSTGPGINFKPTAKEMLDGVNAAMTEKVAILDAVAKVPNPTFDSVFAPVYRVNGVQDVIKNVNYLLSFVGTTKEVRDAGMKSNQIVEAFASKLACHKDFYKAVRVVHGNQAEMAKLNLEDKRLVEKVEKKYRQAKLNLPADKRNEFARLSKEIVDLELAFMENLSNNIGKVQFTHEELEGVPEDFFDERETVEEDGITKFVITTKDVDFFPVIDLAKHEATRKRLFLADSTRCPENIKLLQDTVRLRFEIAKILGYSSYAEYALEYLMVKTPQAAKDMLSDLHKRLIGIGKQTFNEVAQLKKDEVLAAGGSFEGLFDWDYSFYKNKYIQNKAGVDMEIVREYLPLDHVLKCVLHIYEQMLGIRIVESNNSDAWHEDVQLYEVWEANKDDLLGYFYADLFPRDGKADECVCYNIRSGFMHADGSFEKPVAALVANLPKPTLSLPALLTHEEVESIMHELGHVFHNVLSKCKWSILQGTSVEKDFVEGPSQMLEQWVWNPDVLSKITCHYKTRQPMPSDMIDRLVASKNVSSSISYLRQVMLATFDLAIHDSKDGMVDVNGLYNSLSKEMCMRNVGYAKINPVATFNHLMEGYESIYFIYLWSEIFSADMFYTRFVKEGLDNPQTGRDYRNLILQPGSSRAETESLELFLGRKPNNEAFMKSIGL